MVRVSVTLNFFRPSIKSEIHLVVCVVVLFVLIVPHINCQRQDLTHCSVKVQYNIVIKSFVKLSPSTGHRVAPPWFGVTCGSLRACLCASRVLFMCQWWLACACVRSAARWRMASRGDTGGPDGRLQTCSSAWTRSRRPRKAGRESPAWGKQQLKQQQCAE